jgi:lipoprotein Spr/probable lipoprotein NlpC
MKNKALLLSTVLLLALLTSTSLNSLAGFSLRSGLNLEKLGQLKNDSLFLEEYSSKLQVQLDSTCDPLFVSTVAGWLGVPYRHAGYSKSGIDCSGFVSHIYKDVYGIDLTHSSSQMIYQMKTLVKKSELRMGDILFFRIHGRRISHVGMYLKDGKFIHASSYSGITVNDLSSPYYKKAYYIAGRPEGKFIN